MGSSYEYLIASLPFLSLQVSPRLTLEELNQKVFENTSEKNFEKFQKVDMWKLDVCPTPAVADLQNFSENLKGEITEIRKAKVKNLAVSTSILPGEFMSLNPLEAELAINKVLWYKMEELAFGHDFDFTEVLIYKLKLQLLERQFSFNSEVGMKKVKEIILSQKNKEE